MKYEWQTCLYAGEMVLGYSDRALPETIPGQCKIPEDVFYYPAVDTWRERIWRLLREFITDEVKDEFKRNPPEYVVSDDLTWLNNIVHNVTDQFVEMKELTAARLAVEYRAFRAGHATRTNNLALFYEGGLQCLRPEQVEFKARELFLSGNLSSIDEQKFLAAIEEINARNSSGGRRGRLWFCADERNLITRTGGSGHYLVYGGEYLYCLGIRILDKRNAKRILKSNGRPTMFVCDIPMRRIGVHTLCEFAGSILEFLFCELIDRESHALSPGAGSGFSLTTDLPGKYIIGHYHPALVYDPL